MLDVFQVTVEPSGRHFQVGADETLLAAAIRQAIGFPYSCRNGVCGSCKCRLVSGRVTLGPRKETALSVAERAAGFVLACQGYAHSDVVLESRQVAAAGGHVVRKLPARVTLLEQMSHDVMRLRLQLPSVDSFDYFPGQYVEVILKNDLRRSYSMASAAAMRSTERDAAGNPGRADTIELHVRHMPGGIFTDQVFSTLKVRDLLRIEGPYGGFHLREDPSKPIVLLASGTGFAPIKALLEQLRIEAVTRPVDLYWGGRRPGDIYLDGWVRQRLGEMPNLRYVPVVSDAVPADGWSGRTGFVHAAVLHDHPDLSGHQVYACGAPVVVESARAAYTTLAGLHPDDFFADSFVSEADRLRAA